jgi:hypothetical protein
MALLPQDANLDRQQRIVDAIVTDMRILSGDIVGPADSTWQDVAGTLACGLEVLALHIHKIREGQHSKGNASLLTMLIDQVTEIVTVNCSDTPGD